MLPIYLCEDIPEQLQFFAKTIKNYIIIEGLDCELVFSHSNPYQLLDACKASRKTSLYFLDIDFKMDMNGLELAREIRKYDPRGFIVFLTTHGELCYMTFTYKVEALDFVLKDDVNYIPDKICQCIRNAYDKYLRLQQAQIPLLPLRLGEKELVFDPDEIIFCEVSKTPHKIILHKADSIVEFTAQMKDLEKSLGSQFYRCHRSYLINTKQIREIDRKKKLITFQNGESCQISVRKIGGLSLV